MKSSMPAKSTMLSNTSPVRFRERPNREALSQRFSTPVRSGWNPAPSWSSAPMRPATLTHPASGSARPAITLSRVLLPAPLVPPGYAFAGFDAETDVLQRVEALLAAAPEQPLDVLAQQGAASVPVEILRNPCSSTAGS